MKLFLRFYEFLFFLTCVAAVNIISYSPPQTKSDVICAGSAAKSSERICCSCESRKCRCLGNVNIVEVSCTNQIECMDMALNNSDLTPTAAARSIRTTLVMALPWLGGMMCCIGLFVMARSKLRRRAATNRISLSQSALPAVRYTVAVHDTDLPPSYHTVRPVAEVDGLPSYNDAIKI